MAKLNIQSVFDTATSFATQAGQQLREYIDYSVSAMREVITQFRNGITFQDNIDCKILLATIPHAVDTTINAGSKKPFAILTGRSITPTYGIDSFHWFIDAKGETKVNINFTSAPPAAIPVVLIILYG